MMMETVKALFFDVFGTVVDWRSGVIRELTAFGQTRRHKADWTEFADAWRGLYQPAMEDVRSGRRDWVNLDQLHRESLVTLLGRFGIDGVSNKEIDGLRKADVHHNIAYACATMKYLSAEIESR